MNDFIKNNIEKYGLTGTNITPNPSRNFLNVPYNNALWTKNNHFVWGYSGNSYNWRGSSTCMYWTDYGVPSKNVKSIKEESKIALKEIYDVFGKFAIQNTNKMQSMLINVAKENNIPHEVIKFKLDKKYILEFANAVRCNNRKTILKVTAELLTDLPIIYTPSPISLVNANYCTVSNKAVGPPNWALVDCEDKTAINRWLIKQNRPGVPDFWRWSPNLMKAIFSSQRFTTLLQFNINNSNLDEFFDAGIEPEAPKIPHVYDKSTEKWLTPFYRLLEKFNIEYGFDIGKERIEEVYGSVVSRN